MHSSQPRQVWVIQLQLFNLPLSPVLGAVHVWAYQPMCNHLFLAPIIQKHIVKGHPAIFTIPELLYYYFIQYMLYIIYIWTEPW